MAAKAFVASVLVVSSMAVLALASVVIHSCRRVNFKSVRRRSSERHSSFEAHSSIAGVSAGSISLISIDAIRGEWLSLSDLEFDESVFRVVCSAPEPTIAPGPTNPAAQESTAVVKTLAVPEGDPLLTASCDTPAKQNRSFFGFGSGVRRLFGWLQDDVTTGGDTPIRSGDAVMPIDRDSVNTAEQDYSVLGKDGNHIENTSIDEKKNDTETKPDETGPMKVKLGTLLRVPTRNTSKRSTNTQSVVSEVRQKASKKSMSSIHSDASVRSGMSVESRVNVFEQKESILDATSQAVNLFTSLPGETATEMEATACSTTTEETTTTGGLQETTEKGAETAENGDQTAKKRASLAELKWTKRLKTTWREAKEIRKWPKSAKTTEKNGNALSSPSAEEAASTSGNRAKAEEVTKVVIETPPGREDKATERGTTQTLEPTTAKAARSTTGSSGTEGYRRTEQAQQKVRFGVLCVGGRSSLH